MNRELKKRVITSIILIAIVALIFGGMMAAAFDGGNFEEFLLKFKNLLEIENIGKKLC